ncbi:MAG: hypothetical protein E7254_08680 [Lachnospiraceae bacterium]|nr:hypothetical protein [Lachnospiraceae bacterium]
MDIKVLLEFIRRIVYASSTKEKFTGNLMELKERVRYDEEDKRLLDIIDITMQGFDEFMELKENGLLEKDIVILDTIKKIKVRKKKKGAKEQ